MNVEENRNSSNGVVKSHPKKDYRFFSIASTLKHYSIVIALVVFSASICYLIKDIIGYQVVSFLLLFQVSILAIFFSTGPILVAAILSALVWDIFFIPPQFTIHIEDPVDLLMLIMFFIIALVNGIYTSRVKRQEQRIRTREERTNALYQLTKNLITINGFEEVEKVAIDFIEKYFKIPCQIFIRNDSNKIDFTSSDLHDDEKKIVLEVFSKSIKAGKYTDILNSSDFTFYPLQGNSGNIGIIAIKQTHIFTHGEGQFWEACLSQISGKYEREFLREAARKTYLISESEKLYKTLFNSISHELRIPVATIMGASDTLLSQEYPEEIRKKLYEEVNTASIRLNRLIENLLNMSRLESGRITPHADWCDVHDLVNKISESLANELKPFVFSVNIPSEMPLVKIDFGLMEQVIHNLILNATQHSPFGSEIDLTFNYENSFLVIQVMDSGKGFSEAELTSVFNKFHRGKDSKAGGTGLGLSIVKGFVEAHRGTVVAENRKNSGALFTIRIPVEIPDISFIKKTED